MDQNRPGTFTAVYWLDAASFVLAVPVLLAASAAPRTQANSPPDPRRGSAGTGYRIVWRDATFARLWLLAAVLIAVGYAQFNSALPAIATGAGGLSAGTLGMVFAANTITVVLAQLVVRGSRPTVAARESP